MRINFGIINDAKDKRKVVVGGGWRMEDGGWRMEDGGRWNGDPL